MKNILLTICTVLFLTQQLAFAGTHFNLFEKNIKDSNIAKGGISISFKEVDTRNVVKNYNAEMQISPASTQKVLTYLPTLKTLGENYKFSTELYKTKDNKYYLKLGADPYLTYDKLKDLMANIKLKNDEALQVMYIDDTILDNVHWGEGWQWDDKLNVSMPKFGAYNLDGNLYNIVAVANKVNSPARIFTEVFYPTSFINNTVSTKDVNNIQINTDETLPNNVLIVNGMVSSSIKTTIPVDNIKRYFKLRLADAIRENKIIFTGKYSCAKVPSNATLVAKIETPIKNANTDVLKNSSNMISETTYKLAGGKFKKTTGNINSAVEMFNSFCAQNNLDCSSVKLTDGSGVSKNNLVTADFMTDYLVTINKVYGKEKLNSLLAKPGEGTLNMRLLSLKDNLHAKTGTLSNISGIIGYLDAKSGKRYAFAIYETDGKAKMSDMKLFEDFIIKEAYNKL
ncbi:D-alanyl-D-alanine carboxypeptidase/D-alanyl-D-alanine-endopeptidase [bacterium]|nr:D-alanyl-D-alanine carboxypeptidase/D-alanyl-D-alanine-endopeptidase [bacterium]